MSKAFDMSRYIISTCPPRSSFAPIWSRTSTSWVTQDNVHFCVVKYLKQLSATAIKEYLKSAWVLWVVDSDNSFIFRI